MNEAAVTLVMRMRDEASAGLANFGQTASQSTVATSTMKTSLNSATGEMDKFGKTAESARLPASRFRYETIALGAAMSSVGGLIGKINSPAAKMVGNFLQISGAILLTVSSIAHVLPYLSSLVNSLRNVAIMQSIVKALSGPAGWLTLGAGLVAGVGAGYAISSATSKPSSSGTVINNYVQGSVVTEGQISNMNRRQIVLNQSRNAGKSGIK